MIVACRVVSATMPMIKELFPFFEERKSIRSDKGEKRI